MDMIFSHLGDWKIYFKCNTKIDDKNKQRKAHYTKTL